VGESRLEDGAPRGALRRRVVSHRRNGREVRYTVDPERLQAAVQAMTDAAARWNARLRAIKRIAEAEHQKRSQ
jgi:hypothetical protein